MAGPGDMPGSGVAAMVMMVTGMIAMTGGSAGRPGMAACLFMEDLQDGECECGGLTCASLGATQQVSATKDNRYRLLLDRRRCGVALIVQCL